MKKRKLISRRDVVAELVYGLSSHYDNRGKTENHLWLSMTAYASNLSCSAVISTGKLMERQKKTFSSKIQQKPKIVGF